MSSSRKGTVPTRFVSTAATARRTPSAIRLCERGDRSVVETTLWLAVIASGVYHGVNPGMGWPLAVSAGLMGKGRRDLVASLGPLGAGHFFAMAGILAPFAAMTAMVAWQREIRISAGLLVIAAGVYLLIANSPAGMRISRCQATR